MIFIVPFVIPDTTPDVFTDPTDGLLLLHVPPPVASFNVVVEPVHALSIPVTGSIAFTVTTVVV